MKRKLTIIQIIIASSLLFGCDYTYDHVFSIKNNLNKSIMVKYKVRYGNKPDSLFTTIIQSGGEKKIFKATGTRGRRETAPDIYRDSIDEFSILEIYRDSILIHKNFLNRKEWIYEVKSKDKGVYKLEIINQQ